MNLLQLLSLKRVFAFTTLLCVFCFFALLLYANSVNRQGVTELNDLNKESLDLQAKLIDTEKQIATYSSLSRVESRSKELGFERVKNIEYLK